MVFARRPSTFTLVLTAALLVLLGTLAVIQYRWNSRLIENRRATTKQAVQAALSRLRLDVETILEDVRTHFEPNLMHPATTPSARDQRLQDWRREADYPDLVDTLFAIAPGPDGSMEIPEMLARWQPDLEQVVARADIEADGSVRMSWVVPALRMAQPGVMLPLFSAADPAILGRPGVLLVLLDRSVLANHILPELVMQHLAGLDEAFVAHIADGEGNTVYQTDDASAAALGRGEPDTVAALAWTPARVYRASLGQHTTITRQHEMNLDLILRPPVEPPEGVWQIALYHRAGSLETALAQMRVRQLGLVFGVLFVLGAAVVLVFLLAQRTRWLGEQQVAFVAGVSHELRTPLAVIRSLADNLAEGIVRNPEQTRAYGELIRDEGRRLSDMVEQVLDLAAVQSGRSYDLKPTPVVDLFDEALDPVYADEAKHVLVNGDAQALETALHNLVQNAKKHGQGVTGIEVAHDEREVQITVSDQGPGIPTDEQPYLFDAFFRGQQARQDQRAGSGLGLSLVRQIMDAHGGRVTVRSTPGAGSAFTLHLPVLDA